MDVNTRYIQVRGKIEIDKEYKSGDDIHVVVCITSIEDKDNQDGTFDRIFKCRLLDTE